MLSLMRPPKAETLAIFAPPHSWKPFFDKVYGRAPVDLDLYAVVYSLSPDGPDQQNLGDWPSFYRETPAETEAAGQDQPLPEALPPPGELLGPPSFTAVTFKTTLFPAEGGEAEVKGGKTAYTVIASIIPARGRVFFLNLFQAAPDDPAELERLALAWRAEFLETDSEQNLE